MRRPVLAWAAALGMLVMASSFAPASAHDSLISSDPQAGATIAALPEAVHLTFDQPIALTNGKPEASLKVMDPMGMVISAAQADVEGAELSTVLHPTMLMDGPHSVLFRVAGADGHVVQGTFQFTVDRGAQPQAAVDSGPTTGTATLLVHATGRGIPDGKGDSSGTALGTFDVDLATSTLCYRVVTQGIPGITAAHIHSTNTASMTIADEIAIAVDLAGVDTGKSVCAPQRSEERRVGKKCRSRWSPYH